MKKCRKIHKFTLIEMLLALLIVGILLLVALPAFVKAMSGDEVKRAGKTLSNAIAKARAEAIISRGKTQVVFYEYNKRQYVGVRKYGSSMTTWYDLPKDCAIVYAAFGKLKPMWDGFADGDGDKKFLWKDGTDINSKVKHFVFTKDGKLDSASNDLFFTITNKDEVGVASPKNAVKLEVNRFTGEVKWLN